jgi:unsaturated rhamnogalacturonyl hydrolase
MYMLTMLQLEAYRATGDRKYLDRDAKEMVAYLDKLQQPNGLFYHAPDVPFFWGRGDGWFAAGMAEMLRTLPEDHPQRARILDGYRKMMAALLKYQGKDGMWRQLIDHEEAWPESSSSGMFTFAMITGVKNGWLDGPTYGPAARKAWLAVIGYVDQNSDVTQVCAGTGKLNSLEYYSGPASADRRLPRTGSDSVGGGRAAAVGTTAKESLTHNVFLSQATDKQCSLRRDDCIAC